MVVRPLLVCLVLLGCTGNAPSAPTLAQSTWTIVAIDGRALESRPIDGVPRTPNLAFGARSYGGHAGCNALGGLFVERGGRIYTYPGPQTAMGCGEPRATQEAALDAVMRAAPVVAAERGDVLLTGGGHRLRLARSAALRPALDPPEAWQGTALAGQRFELRSLDGAWRTKEPPPTLTFAARTVTLTGFCPAPVSASYAERERTVDIAFGAAPCPTAAALAGDWATVSGPNGELLLAGAGRWFALDNVRRDRPK